MDHFEEAERLLEDAEDTYEAALAAVTDSKVSILLGRTHYLVSLANAHTALAGIQSQRTGFTYVGKMADSVEKDVLIRSLEKENTE